jgi:hypothetical protein
MLLPRRGKGSKPTGSAARSSSNPEAEPAFADIIAYIAFVYRIF